MPEQHRMLDVEQIDEIFCVRLRHPRLEVGGLEDLLTELDSLVNDHGCRKLVISLGPEEPQCMYSLFLAKLVSLQKRLQTAGGALKIAEASENVQQIFEVCRLKNMFDFMADRTAAISALRQ
jgi:anti-anti-sigma factor